LKLNNKNYVKRRIIYPLDTYLNKLKHGFFEILQSSEEPLNDVINNLQFDNVIIHNVTTGLKSQTVVQLSQKADDGWNKMQAEI